MEVIEQTCPKCHSAEVRPIVYGLPSQEGVQAAQEKKIVLGGCFISSSAHKWGCVDCGHRWGGTEPPQEPDDLWIPLEEIERPSLFERIQRLFTGARR